MMPKPVEEPAARTIFIDYGYQEKKPEVVDYRASSLLEASKIILEVTPR